MKAESGVTDPLSCPFLWIRDQSHPRLTDLTARRRRPAAVALPPLTGPASRCAPHPNE